MTLGELKARRRELMARKKVLQDVGESDDLALFVVEEELIDVNTQIRALTPGKRIGTKGGHLMGTEYNYGRKQFQDWRDAQNEPDEDVVDLRAVMKDTLAESRELMSERQWEIFELWTTGMNTVKIAQKLGLNPSSVSRTLGRAKSTLQETASIRGAGNQALLDMGGPILDMCAPSVFKLVLSCVSETQIVYLYLYFGEYLTCEEIGDLLGIDNSSVNRTIHRGLRNIRRAFPGQNVTFEHMSELGDVAYRFYIANNDLNDLPPMPEVKGWGRAALCWKKPYKYRGPAPRVPPEFWLFRTGKRPPQLGKLVTALLERRKKYLEAPATLVLHWLRQIFHGLAARLKHGAK